MSATLKRCPLWDKDHDSDTESHILMEEGDCGEGWYVACDCGVRTRTSSRRQSVIEQWNTRPLEQELLAACKAVASTPSDGQFVLVTRETLLCVLDAIAHAEAAEGRAG